MNWYWWVICILSIALFALVLYILLYQRQMKRLIQQMHFIINKDTNKLLTTDIHLFNIDSLANEINLIIGKYKHAYRKAERSNRNFKEIITNISHDLRTPLTSAIGYMQMIESNHLSEEKRKNIFTSLISVLQQFVPCWSNYLSLHELNRMN